MPHWFEYPAERNSFARVLVESRQVTVVEDIIDFYEKPYKWENEYELWVRFGKPLSDDEVVWSRFVEELDGLQDVEVE